MLVFMMTIRRVFMSLHMLEGSICPTFLGIFLSHGYQIHNSQKLDDKFAPKYVNDYEIE